MSLLIWSLSDLPLLFLVLEPNNDSPMNSAAAELWDDQEGKRTCQNEAVV